MIVPREALPLRYAHGAGQQPQARQPQQQHGSSREAAGGTDLDVDDEALLRAIAADPAAWGEPTGGAGR